jgi:hypothetical protein
MNPYEAMIEQAKNNTVTINLLVTLQCTLACRHCFFGCSPKGSQGREDLGTVYMSNDVLGAVWVMVQRFQELDVNVEVNVIGGEPTINLNRFSEIMDIVGSWGVKVTMVTNGWWLARPETSRRFFQAIQHLVDTDGDPEESISVRISNDAWHDEWRKQKLMNDISCLWRDSDYAEWVCEDYEMYCSNCGRTQETGDVCEECENATFRDYYNHIVPEPNPNGPWIHMEQEKQYTPIQSGYCQVAGSEITCDSNSHYDLSFEPDGALMDICCRGSYLRAGTVYDDPIELLCYADMFLQDKHPRCGTCMEDAREWVEQNLAGAKQIVSDARNQYEEQQ